ncbi:MAG: glycerophosphodiester phosphodiesterase [Mesorhizobium sp.]
MNHDLAWLIERPIAHRGFHDMNNTRWENTLSAFEAAAGKGYAIECDVMLTGDGVPVIFHDHDLQRLGGQGGLVWQKTAAEMGALAIGGTADHAPTLEEALALVDGRVPMVIELKGIYGHDDGLVEAVAALLRRYQGKAAIMSFDHWLIRQFPDKAAGIAGGLTAWGDKPHEIDAHFTMLDYGISFASYHYGHLPNRFVSHIRDDLSMPVITWTVRDGAAVKTTFEFADQMTFEGFEPDLTV